MKRKIFSLFLALCLMLSLLPSIALTASAADTWIYPESDPGEFTVGDGTELDPYAITNAQALADLAWRVNNGNNYSGKYFKLTANIVLNDNVLAADGTLNSGSFIEWTPIGGSNSFYGTFDGDGHTVSGIYINSSEDKKGLFGYIFNGAVQNLGITDSYIYSSGMYIGGVAGYSHGTMANCYNTSTVKGGTYVGGVLGRNSGSGVVENCYNAGNVSGSGFVGGVVGYSYANYISYCYNTSVVKGGSSGTGGIVGQCWNNISYCYNTGNIEAPNRVGGIAGETCNNAEILNCYNTGKMICAGEYTGGIIGWQQNGTTSYCYSTGSVTGGSITGGIIGRKDGSVTSCYYDKPMSGCDYGIGNDNTTTSMGLEASAMTGTGMFSGGKWTTQDGLYPRLADPGATFDMDETDAAMLYALPAFLDSGDTVKSVTKNFNVGTLTGASWSMTANSAISFDGINASVTKQAADTNATLTVTYNGLNRSIDLTVPAYEIWDGSTVATEFSGGTGKSGDPYQISRGEELAYLRYLVNNGELDNVNNGGSAYAGLYYELTSDIFLNEAASNFENWGTSAPSNTWTPIGDSTNKFTGSFNGNTHTVSGIFIRTSSVHQGLFGCISGAVIQNVGIVDSYISAGGNVGGVAGYAVSSTITDCFNAASISGSSDNVGGILGYGEGVSGDEVIVERCYNSGTVESTGYYVGGIIGEMNKYGSLSNCYNTGSISGNSCSGGIAGDFRLTSIRYSYNIGSVSGGYYVGGIAGYCWDYANVLEYSYNAGSISGDNYAGGVGGEFGYATVQFCYNTGSVSGTNYAGGFLGSDYEHNTFSNCYYDKQMCPVANGVGTDSSITGMDLLTSAMTSSTMFSDVNWTTGTGVYPMLAGMDSTDAAYVSAATANLAGTSADYETVNYISKDAVASISNGVAWTSGSSSLSINNSNGYVSVVSSDTNVTLTISRGDAARSIIIAEVEHLSSDANLTTVLSQIIAAGSEAGTSDAPKTASISVINSVQSVDSSNLAVSANAIVAFYGDDSTFTTEDADGVTLTAGGNTSVYIKVTAQDGATALYYEVTITRAAAAPSVNTPGYTPDTSGSDSSDNGAALYINDEKITAGTTKTTTENGKSKTTITVDTAKLQDILESEGDGATVLIPMTEGSDISSGILTGLMVKDMEEKSATLVVKTDSATYTLPAEEIDIDKVAEQFGENTDLSNIDVEVTISEPSDAMVRAVANAAEEGGFTLVIQPVEFTVSCTYNGKTAEVTTYNAYVERSIEIPGGVDPGQITTAVVVAPDGTTRSVPTEIIYDNESGHYTAVIHSLTNSVYAMVCNPVEFSDVAEHWAKDAVDNMGARMIVTGDENGRYNPDNNITRAEFATIIVRALGLEQGMGTNSFSDVKSTDWYCGYIETATAYGLISGYKGTFCPNDKITREQAMTIIARAMTVTKLNPNLSDSRVADLLTLFNDSGDASSWADAGIAACLDTGIINGKTPVMLKPKDNITRAETAVITQRLLQKSDLI